jgi:uncharacterized RDD family membrane protein YckC
MAEAIAQPTTGPRATFGTRFVAALIDGAMLFAVSLFLGIALGRSGQGLGTLAGLAYYVYLEGSPSGQTIGKRMMNIRVVDADTGGAIGYGRAVVRYFARILSAIPCALGYFWMLWDDNKQTWHDKIATDVVVPTSAYPVEAWPG